jgi:uncharacterized protein YjbI with pentapeptide repeats
MTSDPLLMSEESDLSRDVATQGGNYIERVDGHSIYAHNVVINNVAPPPPPAPYPSLSEPCEKQKQVAFVIDGSLKDLDPTKLAKLQALVRAIQQLTGDASLTVVDILEGSIRLFLEGSEAGVDRLQELFDSGELTEILGFSAITVKPAKVAGVDRETSSADPLKKMLITAINTQGAQGCDLSRADLSRSNLSRSNLSRSNLSGANFRGADLRGADLRGANLKNSMISAETQLDAKWHLVHDIVNQRLAERDLSGANFSDANLSGADLSRANLSGADLSGANLKGANLKGADLSGANLSSADLSGADLSGANLSGANLSFADLSRANLSRADLSGANLLGANLLGANLIGADLSGANLIGVDLSRTNLSSVDLSRAYLSDADLSGADLSGADLSGADLSGANLSGARVKRAIFTESDGLSESEKANLRSRGAIFEDAPGDRSRNLTPARR